MDILNQTSKKEGNEKGDNRKNMADKLRELVWDTENPEISLMIDYRPWLSKVSIGRENETIYCTGMIFGTGRSNNNICKICSGALINSHSVVTAAHCFCRDDLADCGSMEKSGNNFIIPVNEGQVKVEIGYLKSVDGIHTEQCKN